MSDEINPQEKDSAKELFFRRVVKKQMLVLIASVLLNVALLTFCFYEWQEGAFPVLLQCSFKPQETALKDEKFALSLEQELIALHEKEYAELLPLLDDATLISDGYRRQDLALSLLASLHHFDFYRALQNQTHAFEKKRFAYAVDKKSMEIILFPGISDENFVTIQTFAQSEKWPLSSEGLLIKLQQESSKESFSDEFLKDAFLQTKEFMLAQTLLQRGHSITKEQCLKIVLQGNWQTLAAFVEEQKKALDFSPNTRRKFLRSYIDLGSKMAAQILVESDFQFALQSLDDKEAALTVASLDSDPKLAQKYALGLLMRPRSEIVCQKAQAVLIQLLGKNAEKWDRQKILQHFGHNVGQAPHKIQKSKTLPDTKSAIAQVQAERTKTEKPKIEKTKPRELKEVRVASKTVAKTSSNTSSNASKKTQAKSNSETTYIVQSGDSLWKIAKKFHADIEKLRKINNLENDALKPGSLLRIPKE